MGAQNSKPVAIKLGRVPSEWVRKFKPRGGGASNLLSLTNLFNNFRRERLRACQIAVEEIRALANEDILEVLKGRELANAMYYQRHRLQWEKDMQGPKVVRNRKTDDSSLPRAASRRKARVSQ